MSRKGEFFLNRRFLHRLFLFIIGIIVITFLYYNRSKINTIILPFALGVLISYILNPLVEFFIGQGFRRTQAVVIIYFILVLSIVVALLYIIPITLIEIHSLMETIPFYTEEVQNIFSHIRFKYLDSLPSSFQKMIDKNINYLQFLVLNFLQMIVNGIINSFSSLFSLILGPILGFYMLKDSDKIKMNLVSIFPSKYRDQIIKWLKITDIALGQYIRSQLVVSLIIGILTTIAMYIIGIDFAFLIGILSAVTNIIPYFGPIMGAIPAILIAAIRYPNKIIGIVIVVLVIHQLESGIISPHIVGENVGLHPLTVIFALLVGGSFFGIWGLILGVPVAVLIKIYVVSKIREI